MGRDLNEKFHLIAKYKQMLEKFGVTFVHLIVPNASEFIDFAARSYLCTQTKKRLGPLGRTRNVCYLLAPALTDREVSDLPLECHSGRPIQW